MGGKKTTVLEEPEEGGRPRARRASGRSRKGGLGCEDWPSTLELNDRQPLPGDQSDSFHSWSRV